jgi:hypothetical protein
VVIGGRAADVLIAVFGLIVVGVFSCAITIGPLLLWLDHRVHVPRYRPVGWALKVGPFILVATMSGTPLIATTGIAARRPLARYRGCRLPRPRERPARSGGGGGPMRAVIVYESMFGNTHVIADAVGRGLEPRLEVVRGSSG